MGKQCGGGGIGWEREGPYMAGSHPVFRRVPGPMGTGAGKGFTECPATGR